MQNRHKLIEDNINLVYFVINKNFPRYRADEDLIQVGMIGLCEAANAWDEEKGIFSSFAVRGIYNAICKEFRRRNRQQFTYSLDYQYLDSDDDSVSMCDMLVGDSDVDWVDKDGVYQHLTEKERVIVELKQLGLTHTEIAKKLGVSNQSISNYLRRAKLRLEKTNDY